jgi:wyosine [tRNA(Phe)-imidazoG37] synthetase (radical SAM superfamily)
VDPAVFYKPETLLLETKARIKKTCSGEDSIDYISLVPDGEPTLDGNLFTLISMLKQQFSIPVAVITNGSLLWRKEVAEAVRLADWVSVKVDGVAEKIWRRVNHPDRRLELSKVLDGILNFASGYRGELVSETMLILKENTGTDDLVNLAGFLSDLSPKIAYLSVPSRPPAKADVRRPALQQLSQARHLLEDAGLHVRCLTHWEGDQFTVTADTAQDILAIAAVHPLREDALRRILERTASDWRLVETLLNDGRLRKRRHDGQTYYRSV